MIRIATIEDSEKLMPLLEMRHAESACAPGRFDPRSVRQKIVELTGDAGPGLIGVIEGTTGIEASIGLTVARFWDTMDRHLETLWNFVHPQFRRSDHAKQLVAFAKSAGDRMNLRVLLANAETPETSRFNEIVLGRQMQRSGVIFSHEPRHV